MERVLADAGLCQGYGNCVALDPAHFDLDDDGIVVIVDADVTASDHETTTAAVRSCPAAALRLADGQ